MKKLVIIIALIMFLKPLFPLAEYIFNYDYISKVLCENKEKPELKCNGKCHLMKELAKVSDTETSGTKPISQDKKVQFHETESLFFQKIDPLNVGSSYFEDKNPINNHYSNLYSHQRNCDFFHPPSFLV